MKIRELKNAIIKMKNLLYKLNSKVDTTEGRFRDLKTNQQKSPYVRNHQNKIEIKKRQHLKDLYDNNKRVNTHAIRSTEREERE